MGTRTTVTSRIEGSYETVTTELFITDCWSCGVVFAIPRSLEARRRADGAAFYCPNGHAGCFKETELDRERKKAERLQRYLDDEQAWRRSIQDQLDAEKRSAAAYRGHLTRMRNRVARGVCPQPGCKRSFTELHDHVRDCHPELLTDLPELGEAHQ